MDKDKIIIVAYVDVGSIDGKDVPDFLETVANAMDFDESVKKLVVPIRNTDTHIECINPQLLSEEKYKEAEAVVDRVMNAVCNLAKDLERSIRQKRDSK